MKHLSFCLWHTHTQTHTHTDRHTHTHVCYTRIPKSAMLCDLNEQSVNQWQNEWDRSWKGAITKSFFPNIADRLKLRINTTLTFTAIVTGHGNIKTYRYKYKIIESPKCSCKEGDQSVDHILLDWKLLEQDRAVVTKLEKWPVSKDKRYKILQKLQRIHKQHNIGQSIVNNQNMVDKELNCK
jgi:hypothetical protein